MSFTFGWYGSEVDRVIKYLHLPQTMTHIYNLIDILLKSDCLLTEKKLDRMRCEINSNASNKVIHMLLNAFKFVGSKYFRIVRMSIFLSGLIWIWY